MVPLLFPFLHGPFRDFTFYAESRKRDMMDGDSYYCDDSFGKVVSHFISLVPNMFYYPAQPDICMATQKSLNFSGYFVRCASIG
ncbi:hypothetical protein AVEN_232531-1 [Araneus ventricosus]|uniref:Uncharacterized protein n=1 Tax=Araneus ventricosus TaxID=182803 RepID=A0A4Y2KPK4_ARAVE|nr:hypothetical protein AVEN_232531-1 [Araneus ventricosus]